MLWQTPLKLPAGTTAKRPWWTYNHRGLVFPEAIRAKIKNGPLWYARHRFQEPSILKSGRPFRRVGGGENMMNDEVDSPGNRTPGGRVNQRFFDDSSSALGLSHHDRIAVRGTQQDQENESYRNGILEAGLVDWLIDYFKQDPETRHLQPSDMEQLAIDRYLSIRGGAHERARNYVGAGMDLRSAIMKAEADLSQAEDIEEHSEYDDDTPDEIGEWSQAKIEDLMKAPVKPTGGGSKSKSYKSRRIPDATVVEQALRRDMAA